MASGLHALTRVATGVAGLDTVLGGGLIERGLYIVKGLPGVGKTILANQIAFTRARAGDSVVFFTLLAEPHDRMLDYLGSMSFADRSVLPDRLTYLSAYGALEDDGAPSLLRMVQATIRKRAPRLLLLDGLYIARERMDGGRELRRFIYQLQAEAVAHDCTMIFLTNGPLADFAPEYTMVDGLVELTEDLVDARTVRMLHVLKQRGGPFLQGRHVFRITDDGIVVWPRLEVAVRRDPPRTVPTATKVATGVPDLDTMLGGGVPTTSTTLLVGPSGSGKTTTGLLFLGRCTAAEPGVLFGCYEAEEELHQKAASIGVDLRALVRDGAVALVRHLPFESSLDEMGHALIDAVRRTGARRVLIDGLGAFEQAAVHASRLQPFFTALSLTLRAAGATVMCTAEAKELFLPSELVLRGISPVAENVLLLRLVEHDSRLVRLMSIIKVRQSGFDPTIRPFEIHDRGIAILPAIDRVEEIIRGAAVRPLPGLMP